MNNKIIGITQYRLKELFSYDKLTGLFTRTTSRGGRIIGSVAGYINNRGYIQIKVDKVDYRAHRLAWMYEYGEFPKHEIDHINHNRSDNRIVNLRDLTHSENQRNCSATKNSILPMGVCFKKAAGKYQARIMANGKRVHLGYFNTISEAKKVRQLANVKHGYHENHGKQNHVL